ncbi:hypothetical protein NEHOM01_1194 [Nematocida homosporus]|uniref:uncharacterized protein n=1 Tax=Nematocida homosporus TaxID=1912981 RepID=UPI002220D82A|nr:uncharacterized protein NEHOM01_1194 [Nematocida homosporus]KAI5185971.1 hypothetical protein NEHOM01_1194 [Nematocida homosporus]
MDELFRKNSDELVSLLTELNRVSTGVGENLVVRKELLRKIKAVAEELDLIYRVSLEGFNKENEEVSESVFLIAKRLFNEIEEKEVWLQEAKAIVADSERELSGGLEAVLEYSQLLAKYSKCPLLWTEGTPLEGRFPAYPTDEIIQQSILRIEREKKVTKSKPKAITQEESNIPEHSPEEEFKFEF